MDIRSCQTITTEDNHYIEIELAGVASRFFAALLDQVVIFCLLFLLAFFFSFLRKTAPEFTDALANLIFPKDALHYGAFWTFLAIILGGSMVMTFSYYFLQEWLWQGQTLGKRALQIKAVRQDGQPLGMWEAFGRNLIKVFLDYPLGLGIFAILISSKEKRFGDYLVGSIVIANPKMDKPLLSKLPTEQRATSSPQMMNMTTDELELLRGFLLRQPGFNKSSQTRLAGDLCDYFAARLHLPALNANTLDTQIATLKRIQESVFQTILNPKER